MLCMGDLSCTFIQIKFAYVFYIFEMWSSQAFQLKIYCNFNIELHCFYMFFMFVCINNDLRLCWQYAETCIFVMSCKWPPGRYIFRFDLTGPQAGIFCRETIEDMKPWHQPDGVRCGHFIHRHGALSQARWCETWPFHIQAWNPDTSQMVWDMAISYPGMEPWHQPDGMRHGHFIPRHGTLTPARRWVTWPFHTQTWNPDTSQMVWDMAISYPYMEPWHQPDGMRHGHFIPRHGTLTPAWWCDTWPLHTQTWNPDTSLMVWHMAISYPDIEPWHQPDGVTHGHFIHRHGTLTPAWWCNTWPFHTQTCTQLPWASLPFIRYPSLEKAQDTNPNNADQSAHFLACTVVADRCYPCWWLGLRVPGHGSTNSSTLGHW